MTFKVGDRGKTRGGDLYGIIGVHGDYLWVETDRGRWTYHADGRWDGGDRHFDLLPPKQKIDVRVAIYGNGCLEFCEVDRGPVGCTGFPLVAIVPVSLEYSAGDGLPLLVCKGCLAKLYDPNDRKAWMIDKDGTWCGNCKAERDRK